MRLGWDEIKRRARAFSKERPDAHYPLATTGVKANCRVARKTLNENDRP